MPRKKKLVEDVPPAPIPQPPSFPAMPGGNEGFFAQLFKLISQTFQRIQDTSPGWICSTDVHTSIGPLNSPVMTFWFRTPFEECQVTIMTGERATMFNVSFSLRGENNMVLSFALNHVMHDEYMVEGDYGDGLDKVMDFDENLRKNFLLTQVVNSYPLFKTFCAKARKKNLRRLVGIES